MNYEELVKELRYCSTTKGMVYCNVNCKYGWEERSEGCKDVLMTDAAAAIEELLPKRGEWIRVREVDIPGEMHPVAFRCMCSMCRNEYVFPRIPQYCPDCGSMNTAKLEVQE